MPTDSQFPVLERYRAECQARIERVLDDLLPDDGAASPRLARAMRYAALGGGKRIRPLLAYAACRLAGGEPEQADVPAAAVELIHAYSLVHDDLPAMDDDDLRRGQPTCHRAFDEATAILAGDTLHTLAFELLAERGAFDDRRRVAMIRCLTAAAGVSGMAAGQMQDMLAHGEELTLAALEEMHYLKTGRLITAALELGGLAAGADQALLDLLRRYGNRVGLAFQIRDDILDVTATTEEMGKPSGSDSRHQKSTFPNLIGMEASRERADTLGRQAAELAAECGETGRILEDLAHFIVARSN